MENCRKCAASPETFLVTWFTNVPAYACRVCGTAHPERRIQARYDSSNFQTLKLDNVGRTLHDFR